MPHGLSPGATPLFRTGTGRPGGYAPGSTPLRDELRINAGEEAALILTGSGSVRRRDAARITSISAVCDSIQEASH